LEHDKLVLAEVTAREIGRVTIAEAHELTALVARKEPHRHGRFAARRWSLSRGAWGDDPPWDRAPRPAPSVRWRLLRATLPRWRPCGGLCIRKEVILPAAARSLRGGSGSFCWRSG